MKQVYALSSSSHVCIYIAAMFCMNTQSVDRILSMGHLPCSMIPYTDGCFLVLSFPATTYP